MTARRGSNRRNGTRTRNMHAHRSQQISTSFQSPQAPQAPRPLNHHQDHHPLAYNHPHAAHQQDSDGVAIDEPANASLNPPANGIDPTASGVTLEAHEVAALCGAIHDDQAETAAKGTELPCRGRFPSNHNINNSTRSCNEDDADSLSTPATAAAASAATAVERLGDARASLREEDAACGDSHDGDVEQSESPASPPSQSTDHRPLSPDLLTRMLSDNDLRVAFYVTGRDKGSSIEPRSGYMDRPRLSAPQSPRRHSSAPPKRGAAPDVVPSSPGMEGSSAEIGGISQDQGLQDETIEEYPQTSPDIAQHHNVSPEHDGNNDLRDDTSQNTPFFGSRLGHAHSSSLPPRPNVSVPLNHTRIPVARSSNPPPNRNMSSTVTTHRQSIVVSLPGRPGEEDGEATERPAATVTREIEMKQYTKLPEHRPALRRDKPVRVRLPGQEQARLIYPAPDRSFVFIPRDDIQRECAQAQAARRSQARARGQVLAQVQAHARAREQERERGREQGQGQGQRQRRGTTTGQGPVRRYGGRRAPGPSRPGGASYHGRSQSLPYYCTPTPSMTGPVAQNLPPVLPPTATQGLGVGQGSQNVLFHGPGPQQQQQQQGEMSASFATPAYPFPHIDQLYHRPQYTPTTHLNPSPNHPVPPGQTVNGTVYYHSSPPPLPPPQWLSHPAPIPPQWWPHPTSTTTAPLFHPLPPQQPPASVPLTLTYPFSAPLHHFPVIPPPPYPPPYPLLHALSTAPMILPPFPDHYDPYPRELQHMTQWSGPQQ